MKGSKDTSLSTSFFLFIYFTLTIITIDCWITGDGRNSIYLSVGQMIGCLVNGFGFLTSRQGMMSSFLSLCFGLFLISIAGRSALIEFLIGYGCGTVGLIRFLLVSNSAKSSSLLRIITGTVCIQYIITLALPFLEIFDVIASSTSLQTLSSSLLAIITLRMVVNGAHEEDHGSFSPHEKAHLLSRLSSDISLTSVSSIGLLILIHGLLKCSLVLLETILPSTLSSSELSLPLSLNSIFLLFFFVLFLAFLISLGVLALPTELSPSDCLRVGSSALLFSGLTFLLFSLSLVSMSWEMLSLSLLILSLFSVGGVGVPLLLIGLLSLLSLPLQNEILLSPSPSLCLLSFSLFEVIGLIVRCLCSLSLVYYQSDSHSHLLYLYPVLVLIIYSLILKVNGKELNGSGVRRSCLSVWKKGKGNLGEYELIPTLTLSQS